MKGHKYAFLKNPNTLSNGQQQQLAELIRLYPSLGEAYRLKTVFNDLWDMPDKPSAHAFPALDFVLVESGGDNLSATFSPELADLTIYVIDVSAGDKIPREGGPGITKSDLLVINKIDLALYVGASLDVMDRDAKKMRGERPFVFSDIKTGEGLARVVDFIVKQGMLVAVA